MMIYEGTGWSVRPDGGEGEDLLSKVCLRELKTQKLKVILVMESSGGLSGGLTNCVSISRGSTDRVPAFHVSVFSRDNGQRLEGGGRVLM